MMLVKALVLCLLLFILYFTSGQARKHAIALTSSI